MNRTSKLLSLSTLLLLLGVASGQDTLHLVVSVARHGARSPQTVMPFNATSEQFANTSELLMTGFQQHVTIGKHLRQRYINEAKLLSDKYDPTEIYVQATDKSRTQLSAIGQMTGLYPENAASVYDWYNGTGAGYKMTNLSASENFITRLSPDSCKLFGTVHEYVKNSQSYIEARQYYYNTYHEKMAKMIDWENVTATNFDDTCEYMYFSAYDPKMELNFTAKPFDHAYCGAWLNGWIYEMCLALDIQWELVSYEFLQQLYEFSQYLLEIKPKVDQLPTFWKYFKKQNSAQVNELPKYIMYISHDEIMGAFFKALHSDHIRGVPPAGDIYIEFFTPAPKAQEEKFLTEQQQTERILEASDIQVRIFFNETVNQTGENLDIPYQYTQNKTFTLDAFKTMLENQLTSFQFHGQDVTDVCGNTNFQYNQTFYNPEKWRDQMDDLYTALNDSAIFIKSGLAAVLALLVIYV